MDENDAAPAAESTDAAVLGPDYVPPPSTAPLVDMTPVQLASDDPAPAAPESEIQKLEGDVVADYKKLDAWFNKHFPLEVWGAEAHAKAVTAFDDLKSML